MSVRSAAVEAGMTFPNHIDTETGKLVFAPENCDCPGCRQDRWQEELYDEVQMLVSSALRKAKDLQWGAGEPVATVLYMVEDIGYRLYPKEPEPPRYRKRTLSGAVKRQVMERDSYRCQWPDCGTWLDLAVGHIIPVVKGGTDDLDNLQTLCRPHNSSKGVKVL